MYREIGLVAATLPSLDTCPEAHISFSWTLESIFTWTRAADFVPSLTVSNKIASGPVWELLQLPRLISTYYCIVLTLTFCSVKIDPSWHLKAWNFMTFPIVTLNVQKWKYFEKSQIIMAVYVLILDNIIVSNVKKTYICGSKFGVGSNYKGMLRMGQSMDSM